MVLNLKVLLFCLKQSWLLESWSPLSHWVRVRTFQPWNTSYWKNKLSQEVTIRSRSGSKELPALKDSICESWKWCFHQPETATDLWENPGTNGCPEPLWQRESNNQTSENSEKRHWTSTKDQYICTDHSVCFIVCENGRHLQSAWLKEQKISAEHPDAAQ